MRPRVLYFAPGSGLGHLNRALAVCLELRALGVTSRIVTNSPFAEGIAHAARFPITAIASSQWARDAPAYLAATDPELAIFDTFPWGMRAEWRTVRARCVYMARRLRWQTYLDAITGSGSWDIFVRVILLEPLSADHEQALCVANDVVRLPGPVRLRPGAVNTLVPANLQRILDSGNAWLVIHGGVQSEVDQLIAEARARKPEGSPLAIVSPWDGAFDYYPATNIIAQSAHVITGAGYNSMADMLHRPAHHTAIAFPRRFDNQAARLAQPRPDQEGTTRAASAIAVLLGI
jgi:hypothetical protein